VSRSGAQEDWAVVGGAEQVDAHIGLAGVAQTAGAQLDVLVAFAIGAQRAVVVHAAHHEGPVAGADLAVRDFLEIENVEGCGWVGDYVGG
jgi:hypothetical protein